MLRLKKGGPVGLTMMVVGLGMGRELVNGETRGERLRGVCRTTGMCVSRLDVALRGVG